jgi:NitT/TauT family transport system ATP-binding protein
VNAPLQVPATTPHTTSMPHRVGVPALRVEDVRFGYGEKTIIDGISFDAHEGDFVSLIGPSGCGKSTLLAMMDGILAPDSGSIVVEGEVPRIGAGSRATVFQNFALMPWKSVLGNVLLGLRHKRPELGHRDRVDVAMEYLSKVGLASSAKLYPRHLSGGMQQRVGLARAFAVQPRLLLMDEPFGALDAQNAEILREEVRALVEQERRTVVFVTHNLDEALQLSSRILLMSAGPSTIRDDVTVALPPPDSTDHAVRYDEYRSRLWTHLRDEVNATRDQGAVR